MNNKLSRALVIIHNSRATLATESQRDSGPKPKVTRHELPWVNVGDFPNPNGVAAVSLPTPTQPRWGWLALRPQPQGSSCLATLGWRPQSLWDCPADPRQVSGNENGFRPLQRPLRWRAERPGPLPIRALKRRERRAPLARWSRCERLSRRHASGDSTGRAPNLDHALLRCARP